MNPTILKRLAATLLIPIAIVLYLKFVSPDAENDLEPKSMNPGTATIDSTPQNRDSSKNGQTEKKEKKPVTNNVKPEPDKKKTKNEIEPTPGRTGDLKNPGKANTKATPPQEGATTNVNLDKQNPVVEIETLGAKTKINSKGYWEADIGDGIELIYIPAGTFTVKTIAPPIATALSGSALPCLSSQCPPYYLPPAR